MKNTINRSLFWLFLLPVFITNCKKTTPAQEKEPAFQTFVIEKGNNPSLTEDITFTIKGDTVFAQAPDQLLKKLKPSFSYTGESVIVGQTVQKSGSTEIDFSIPVTYSVVAVNGVKKNYYVKVDWVQESIPHITINTEGGEAVVSKSTYVNATISIDGKGKYEDYSGKTKIKGRGNTTWLYPKKPYRLKLDSKAELFGLSAEKDWILLANYLDPTLMLTAVSMKIGEQVKIPYINHVIPVDVTLNGKYLGSYNLTEQIEVESNRVNVGDGGVLLEMDKYYDEEFKFKSANYNLPVMIKYPELTSDAQIAPIQKDFNAMEDLIAAASFPANNYKNYFDIDALAKYTLIYFLTDNEELNHPKSTYMHKSATGKYTMGPIWDFDWAYGQEGGGHFLSATGSPFWTSTTPLTVGTKFFTRFLSDPEFVALLKQKWSTYKANDLDNLVKFVEQYGLKIKTSKEADYAVWKKGDADNRNEILVLQKWLKDRAAFIDTYLQTL